MTTQHSTWGEKSTRREHIRRAASMSHSALLLGRARRYAVLLLLPSACRSYMHVPLKHVLSHDGDMRRQWDGERKRLEVQAEDEAGWTHTTHKQTKHSERVSTTATRSTCPSPLMRLFRQHQHRVRELTLSDSLRCVHAP